MRRLACAAVVGAALLAGSVATAGDEPERDYFAEGTKALGEGRYQDAIDRLEAYADRSAPHPDASFNRGLAYVMRIQNGDEKPGDLGRAAAAFEESLALRSGDDEAADALGLVHGEVARRRSRRGLDSLIAKPTLDRVVLRLASERAWGIGAIVSALLLAAALVARQLKAEAAQLAGTLAIPASAIAMVLLLPLWWGARDLRLHTRSAVVVVPEARRVDETGKMQPGDAIPEAAKVEVSERNGRFVRFRYGSEEGWIPVSTVRILRTGG